MRNGSQYSQSNACQENEQKKKVVDSALARGENLLAVFGISMVSFMGRIEKENRGYWMTQDDFLFCLACILKYGMSTVLLDVRLPMIKRRAVK